MTSRQQIQDRLGSALYRLAALERRAAGVAESPKLAARLVEDVRKLTGELERAFADVQEMLGQFSNLQEAASLAVHRAQLLFDITPTACLLTDATGTIVDANAAAAGMLNVSRRHLIGRSFHLYLSSDREAFLLRLQNLSRSAEVEHWTAKLRPRERSAVEMSFSAALHPEGRILIAMVPVAAAITTTPALTFGTVSHPTSSRPDAAADGH